MFHVAVLTEAHLRTTLCSSLIHSLPSIISVVKRLKQVIQRNTEGEADAQMCTWITDNDEL